MCSTSVNQARRFECVLENSEVTNTVVGLLKSFEEVSFLQWGEKEVYIETKSRRTVSYFSKQSFHLKLVHISLGCSISKKDVVGSHGEPMNVRQLSLASKKMSTPDKLRIVFDHIRETKTVPDLTEDVSAIVNKQEFDKVITAAKVLNRSEEYVFQPRPWQQQALSLIYGQDSRTVLWIFDFDGNSGKTELGKFLRFKNNYQKLPTGEYQ